MPITAEQAQAELRRRSAVAELQRREGAVAFPARDPNAPVSFGTSPIPTVDIPEIADPQGIFPIAPAEQKKVRPRWDEFVDATARGIARVGSAGALAGAGLAEPKFRMIGFRKVPVTPPQKQASQASAAKLREGSDFLWNLSQNPGIAAQNKDVASKALNLIGETIPYITATTAAFITAGPTGAFTVGSLVEGNSAYRVALDSGVDENKAKNIGIGVGVVSGAIEAFGGRYAEQMLLATTKRLQSKIAKAGAVFGIGTLVEALEEGAQEVAQIVGEETYRDVDWNERTTRVLSSMAGGGFLGGAFRGASMAARGTLAAVKPEPTPFDQRAGEIMTSAREDLQAIREEGGIQALPKFKARINEGMAKLDELFVDFGMEVPENIKKKMNELLEIARGVGIPTKGIGVTGLPKTTEGLQFMVPEAEEIAVEVEAPPTEALPAPEAPPAPITEPEVGEVHPKLHIGNITARMRNIAAEEFGVKPEDVGPFLEGAFPTKKAEISMTRAEAEDALAFTEQSLDERLENNLIRTEKDLTQANIDWADIKALRIVLDKPVGARPFTVTRAEKPLIAIIDTEKGLADQTVPALKEIAEALELDTKGTKAELVSRIEIEAASLETPAETIIRLAKEEVSDRAVKVLKTTKDVIQAAIKPSSIMDAGLSADKVLQVVMKKAEVVSAKAWLESARDIVKAHKDLATYIKGRMKGIGLSAAEQNRLLQMVARGRTPSQKAKITAAVEMLASKAEHRQAIKGFRDFAKATRRRFRFGKVKLGRMSPAIRERIGEVFETLDLSRLSKEKRKELLSRDRFIKRVAGSVADIGSSLKEEAEDVLKMPQAQIEELRRLEKSPIENLDTDQINYVRSSLEHLIAVADRKFQIKQRIKGDKENTQKTAAVKEVQQKSKEPSVTEENLGVLGLTKRLFTTQQATLKTLAGKITGKIKKATDFFIQANLDKYEQQKANFSKQFIESGRKRIKDTLGFTKADSKRLDKKTTITLGGKIFNVDFDNLVSIYQHIKADGNLPQLLKTDGLIITITERDAKTLGTIKSKKVVETGTPTLAELRRIEELVESQPKFKGLGQKAFDLNRETITPAVNKTSNELQNHDIYTEKKHWPIHRVFDIRAAGKATESTVAIEQQGRYQPKTGGSARIKITPFRQEFMASLQSDAAYAGGTIPLQDLKVLVNSHRWQQAMRKAGRIDEMKAILTLVDRVQVHSSDLSIVELFGAEQLNNFGKSVLSLRISGYGIQTASIPAAYEVINEKYFLRARPLISAAEIPRAGVREMKGLSDILWMRWEGRRFNYVTGAVAAQHAFDTLILEDSPVTDKFMNQYLWGDQKAIYTIYLAAQEKVAKERGFKKGAQQNKEAAIKLTEKALETQPQWDMIHRNLLTSSPNVLLRGSTMFSSARNAQYNVLQRAWDDWHKGRISTFQWIQRWKGVAYANILVAIVKGLVALGVSSAVAALAFLGGDEEKAKKIVFETAAKRAKRLPLDAVLNLISLPALVGNFSSNIGNEVVKRIKTRGLPLRDLQSIRTGNIFVDISLDVTDTVGSLGKMIQLIITGDKFKSGPDIGKPKWKRERDRFVTGLAELVAIRHGLPFSAPRGEIAFRAKQLSKPTKKKAAKKPVFKRRGTSTRGQKAVFKKRTQ